MPPFQAEALRDLAERLAECNGAVRLVANVLAMAASVSAELCEAGDRESPEASAPVPQRPASIPIRYLARTEPGSSLVVPAAGGEAIAYTEAPDSAHRIATALNLLAAIEEQEVKDAAAQG